MNNKGCEFGTYNKYTYRICYGLDEKGKMDWSTPYYEFYQICRCENCLTRSKYTNGITNSLTISTTDKNKFGEIEKILNDFSCGEKNYVGHKFMRL